MVEAIDQSIESIDTRRDS